MDIEKERARFEAWVIAQPWGVGNDQLYGLLEQTWLAAKREAVPEGWRVISDEFLSDIQDELTDAQAEYHCGCSRIACRLCRKYNAVTETLDGVIAVRDCNSRTPGGDDE